MRPSSRRRPSESGAPRCGQKSSSAETAPPSLRNSTMRWPQTVRPRGAAATSSAVQATYQALRTYMRSSIAPGSRTPASYTAAATTLSASRRRRRASSAAGGRLGVLDGGVGRLRHLQVVLQRRQGPGGERLDVAVLARGPLLVEVGDIFLVVLDHVVHVGAVELRAGELLHLREHALVPVSYTH